MATQTFVTDLQAMNPTVVQLQVRNNFLKLLHSKRTAFVLLNLMMTIWCFSSVRSRQMHICWFIL